MQKILIADSTVEFCKRVRDALCKIHEIEICHDAKRTLELVRTFQPDIMVLDLSMPSMDGITLLEAIRAAGFSPHILATARYPSEYCHDCLNELGVRYMMIKPCSVPATVTRLADMCRRMNDEHEVSAEAKVEKMLFMLGARTKLCGYDCLVCALVTMMQNPTQQVTKELYPTVAKICGGTKERVERAMRNVIVDAWEKRDEQLWQMFFPAGSKKKRKCPSNKDFITKVTACLLHKYEH